MKKSDLQIVLQSSNGKTLFIWSALISILILSIPSNLFLKCCQELGYVNGLFVDYLLPKLYLTNLVSILMIVIWTIDKRHRLAKKLTAFWQNRHSPISTNCWLILLTLGLWVVIGFRQVLVSNAIAALWWYGQASLAVATGLVMFDVVLQVERLKYSYRFWQSLTVILVITIIFQSVLAVYQFTQQRSLAGYWLLGEPSLSQPLGLAKTVTATGKVKILPYGTTAHPNFLAGLLSLYLILMFLMQVRRNSVSNRSWLLTWSTCLILGGTVVWMTQSVSGMLTLTTGMTVIFMTFFGNSRFNRESQTHGSWTKLLIASLLIFTLIIIPLAIHIFALKFPDSLSLVRRDKLQSIALLATIDKPLLGLGLNNFTVQMEQYGQNTEFIRFIQPVHHVGWLWISETGVLGVLFVSALLATIISRSTKPTRPINAIAFCLVTLAPILVLDHYLLSLPSGMMLLITFIFFTTILIGKK